MTLPSPSYQGTQEGKKARPMQKRSLAELQRKEKPSTVAQLDSLTQWYFGAPLHLCLSVGSPWSPQYAASADYEIVEPYRSYHGKGWLHSEHCIKGYDYSAAFWEYVIGPLYCGGIARHSYGQAHVVTADDAERLQALASSIASETQQPSDGGKA